VSQIPSCALNRREEEKGRLFNLENNRVGYSPTGFWEKILQKSGIQSNRILGYNPTDFYPLKVVQ